MHSLHIGFAWLIASSLRASLLAVAILCLQAALRPWLPARCRYALWLPLLLVLVAPILPATRCSIENLFTRPPVVTTAQTASITPLTPTPQLPLTPAPIPGAASAIAPIDLLLPAWALGASAILATGAASYWQTLRRIRTHRVQPAPSLTAAIATAAHQAGLRRPPRLLVSIAIDSPAVTGLLRPTLLLPAAFPAGFTPAEARLILLHELTHLRSLDLPVTFLLCLLQTLHWFNPLLWLAFARIRADREAATDARVLSIAGGDPRAAYGHALLKLQAAPARFGLSLAFVGMFETTGIRSRIRAIGRHRPAHPAWSLAAVALIAALLLVGATHAQSPTPNSPAKGPQIELDARIIEVPSSIPVHLDGGKIPATLDGRTKTSALIQSAGAPAAFLAKIEGTPGVKTLAAPRVTTRSGNRAIITIGNNWLPDPKTKPVLIGETLDINPSVTRHAITLAATFTHTALVDMQVFKGVLLLNGPADTTGTAVLNLSGTTPLQLQTGIAVPGPQIGAPNTGKGVVSSTVSSNVTLIDGQTVVLTEPEPAATRPARLLIFITARLINPKGLPAH
jgi:beta-lactamase regulating signal transducer with metallopeptidase domain